MLEITKLQVSIEDKQIIKGLELTVKSGEIHAIMGPNGSGKSTLAYTLAGHPSYEVTTGKVALDGEDLLEMAPDERAQAGMFLAFQYPVEVPGVPVSKFLKHAHDSRFGEEPEKKFDSVLKFREHLETLADELHVNKELLRRGLNEGFSGGEKKRLEILQMAVLEPRYAVLDETDSGLDIDAIKAVALGVKKNVEKYNTGVIVITHYQRILRYLEPDFVHVMVGGKIVESGTQELVKRLEKEGYKKYL